MRPVHVRLASATTMLLLVGAAGVLGPPASAARAAEPYDVDGDGFADLVVGVPAEDIGSKADAGAVNVIYGSTSGLTSAGDQLWSQDSRGVVGKARAGDQFSIPASGDFNGDGYADLAVGAPGETVDGMVGAGGVTILYGSRRGLRSKGSRFFSQATKGVPGDPAAQDRFGAALVAGDFNGDHRADLAIAAPSDDVGSGDLLRGSVTVLLGSRKGLRTAGAQGWDTGSIPGPGFGNTGTALVAGDIDADGRDDLAVLRTEAVTTLLGAPDGLTSTGSQVFDPTSSGITTVLSTGGQITSLALADLNGDHHADLALGSPYAHRYSDPNDDCFLIGTCDGAVAVLPGTANGSGPVSTVGRQILRRSVGGLDGYTHLGRALAAGDLDGDGRAELCVAADDDSDRAVAVVHFQAGSGIRASASTSWSQGPTGQVSGTDDEGDRFAETLQVAQLGRGPEADLAIGIPGETVDGEAGAGRVAVLYGSGSGVTPTGQQSWSQDSRGIHGSAEVGDAFGTLGS